MNIDLSAQNRDPLDSGRDFSLMTNFRLQADKMKELLATAGIDFVAYDDPSLVRFSVLNLEMKLAAIEKLGRLTDIYELTLSQGGTLRNSKMLLWTALKEFRLTFKSDLLSLVSDDDVVEVYDTNHIQIFCNMKFYEFCSYTIEDIFCRPWHELFERERSEITMTILMAAKDLFTGKVNTYISMDHLGEQSVREINSVLGYEYKMRLKYLSPVFFEQSKKPLGAVAISQARITNEEFVKANESILLAKYQDVQT